MSLADIVSVTITTDSSGVSQAGFGVPLILSANATWAERVRSYTSLSGVGSDFATTTPEYLAASAIFAQDPKPSTIKIGRRALQPTQRHKITVASVANSTAYKVTVGSNTATYTSDSSATNDEIVAGLVSAVNALSGDTLTASATGSTGSQTVQLLANAAANWNAVEVLDTSLLLLEQDHSDPGLATDLAAIYLADPDWYCVVSLYNSKAEVAAIAAWVESNEKLFIAATQDSICATVTNGSDSTSVADALRDSAYARTALIYHPNNGEFADAAWAGNCLPFDPGSETWKFKTLAGVAAVALTSSHITNLKAKRCNYYYTVAGVNITAEGVVSANEFIDVVRGRDWLKARLQEDIFSRLSGSKKIPYTNAGVAVIEAEIRARLTNAVGVGLLSNDPAFTVTVPKVADVSSVDRAARLLPDVSFTATLAGAIHKLELTGTISV